MKKPHQRIGIYICNCGEPGYFHTRVDTDQVREAASKLKNVPFAKIDKNVCGEMGQRTISDDVRKYQLTGVIVAACKANEPKFRLAIETTGLNSYFLEVVNMAELYKNYYDKKATTEKVISTIRELANLHP